MIALLRNRNYSLLWTSQLISQIGNWALFAALPFFVFQLTGSVLATGLAIGYGLFAFFWVILGGESDSLNHNIRSMAG